MLYHPASYFGSSALTRFESYVEYYKDTFAAIAGSLGVSDKNIAASFMEISNAFIQELTEARIDYEYVGNKAFAEDIYKNVKAQFEYLPETKARHKIANFLFKMIIKVLKGRSMPIITKRIIKGSLRQKRTPKQEFIDLARKYIDDIFNLITSKNVMVMCNSTYGEQRIFFNATKGIFSTRDPRDTYTSLQKRLSRVNGVTHFGTFTDETIDAYINMYRSLNNVSDEELLIRFEDFVLNHEKTTDNICDFLDISKKNIDTSTYDIEYSKTRIGLWKSYPNQAVMEKIAVELKDYLYEP
jgi:hypothetical protein